MRFRELWFGNDLVKLGFTKLEQGGVIMDVVNAEQAGIAEESGAVAVMALERVPADIRAEGGVARMADPLKILEIIDAVTIPVMAKCRIGHFAEAEVLQALGVSMIDESEVLTPADPFLHVDKKQFTVPFVCGCRNLGEAVRRIWEGAAMIRTKGEAGTGNIIEAVRHQRLVTEAIREVTGADEEQLRSLAQNFAERYQTAVPEIKEPRIFGKSINKAGEGLLNVLNDIKKRERLPVANLAAGGIATPTDAVLMMKLGSDGVFVGSGIFKSENPKMMAKAIVEAVTHFNDPYLVAEVSKGLGESMKGIEIAEIPQEERLQTRGI